jgi:hypothetical protein
MDDCSEQKLKEWCDFGLDVFNPIVASSSVGDNAGSTTAVTHFEGGV